MFYGSLPGFHRTAKRKSPPVSIGPASAGRQKLLLKGGLGKDPGQRPKIRVFEKGCRLVRQPPLFLSDLYILTLDSGDKIDCKYQEDPVCRQIGTAAAVGDHTGHQSKNEGTKGIHLLETLDRPVKLFRCT